MPIVLGTAGHIDHGKTSLVRALTGIDCDRLEEEKRRGITIELGFAHCPLPDGTLLGIVDVPGHERFVKHMVAGAAGIDVLMLVIAADEGVMPQTREHLDICTLLGIRHGFVALTKVDMVERDWLELAIDDIQTFLKGTFLADAPILPVSAVTGAGIEALRTHVLAQAHDVRPQRGSDIFRLPVDRVFTMKGHGTVLTGTIIAGQTAVGREAVLLPSGIATKVRAIQAHGHSAEHAVAGQRCAVNVQGVDVDSALRGEVLCHPRTLFAARRWIARLTCLASAPRGLRNRTEVHLHHGTREVAARLYFFDRDRLNPGETALTEVRLAEPMVGLFGDRCVVRAYSPLRTVAGGMVLHPLDCVLRRKDADFAARFAALQHLPEISNIDHESLVLAQLNIAGSQGISAARLAVLTALGTRSLEKILQQCASKGLAVCFDKEDLRWIAMPALNALMETCCARAGDFHKREPLKPGMARGVLTHGWPPKLAHVVVERCLRAHTLLAEGDILRLPSHSVSLADDQQGVREKLLASYQQGGLTPPNLKEVLDSLGVDTKKAAPMLALLVQEKALVRVKEELYYSATVVEDITARVRAWFATHDDLDPAGMKDILEGASRKYCIPMLEYLDRERVTMRVGDKRQLRGTQMNDT